MYSFNGAMQIKQISMQFQQEALFQFGAWYYSGELLCTGNPLSAFELQLHFSVINVSWSLWYSKAH